MDATYANIAQLRSRAMFNFQKRQFELANEQATAAMDLFAIFPRANPRWLQPCEGLEELMQLAGRPHECERLITAALEVVESSGPDRGDLEGFYARFLFAEKRYDEAEIHVLAAIDAPCDDVGFEHELLEKIRAARAAG